MATTVAGSAATLRRVVLGERSIRFLAWLGVVAAGAMLVWLAGCACWLMGGGSGPHDLYHAGTIDLAACLAMTAGLVAARRAARGVAAGR
jgi:hypothetical protein